MAETASILTVSDMIFLATNVTKKLDHYRQVSGWKKKFSGDILRQSYQYYADLFGESKKTVKMAIDRLETFRVLRREFRTIFHGEGLVSNNVMYLRLVPEQLYRLTYPEAEPGSVWEEKACRAGTGEGMGGGLPAEPGAAVGRAVGGFPTDLDTGMEELGGSLPTNFHIGVEESGGSLPTNSDTGMEKPGGSLPTNSDTPMEKLGGRGVQNGIQAPTNWEGGGAGNFQGLSPNSEGVPSQNVGTYTEITSENTYRDYNTSINPSIRGSRADMADGMEDVDACMALIRRNIEYEHHMRFDRSDERSLYEELYAVICEVVCVRHRSVRVGGEEYPHALVKERFLKLGEDHLRYVIECMRNTSTRITNIKAYMITALYNAPMTMNHYYQQEVNYDMHGGGWQNAEVEREKE